MLVLIKLKGDLVENHLTQSNIHFKLTLVQSKMNSFRFMIKFYAINSELDIDAEFNRFIDSQLTGGKEFSCTWSGSSQNDNILEIIVDRFNFFIDSGSITSISSHGITEIKFKDEFYEEKTYDSHGNTISEKIETNKWDFRRYHILRYHLYRI